MSKVFRDIIFTVKRCFREKSFVFWNIFYPIILCSFFYLAFSSVIGERKVSFEIGMASDNHVRPFMQKIDVFHIVDMEEEDADQALKDKKIIAYVKADMNMIVADSGIGQTTTQNILKMFKQISYLFEHGAPPSQVNFEADYIAEDRQEHSAYTIIFYSLLAMVSFYGVFGGLSVMENFQADTSEIAKRMVICPIHKGSFLFINMLVIFVLNLCSNTLLILFINYVLGIRLFTDFTSSYILILCGNVWGISLGILLGCIGKLSFGMRTTLGAMIPLFLSAFSGMMSPDIKLMVMEKAPLLDYLNPASIITTGLYRVNLLESRTYFWSGIAVMLGMSLLFFLVSMGSLRRKSYDSL